LSEVHLTTVMQHSSCNASKQEASGTSQEVSENKAKTIAANLQHISKTAPRNFTEISETYSHELQRTNKYKNKPSEVPSTFRNQHTVTPRAQLRWPNRMLSRKAAMNAISTCRDLKLRHAVVYRAAALNETAISFAELTCNSLYRSFCHQKSTGNSGRQTVMASVCIRHVECAQPKSRI